MAITPVQGKQIATASWAINALTASYLNTLNQDLTFNGNLTLNGTASISYLNVLIESASVIYSSGSNQFGDATNDTQTLIGTVIVSGSQQITGSLNVSQGITGSLFGTASFAISSSRAISASWAPLNAGGGNTQIQFNSGSRLLGTGSFTFNYQSQSLQQGFNILASGLYSHAQGTLVTASGNYSHAEGYNTLASGPSSHAEGINTVASGPYTHAEGYNTSASGDYSHAEGALTIAQGLFSHAEGISTSAIGLYSHAEGYLTQATGEASHAEGSNTQAIGNYSHAEGASNKTGITTAFQSSVSSGLVTIDSAYGEVTGNFTPGGYLYLYDTPFDNYYGRAILIIDTVTWDGTNTFVQLVNTGINTSTAYVGDLTFLQNNVNFGGDKTIPGDYSHAEGDSTVSIGNYSHAEGYLTQAIGLHSHTQGQYVQAIGEASHAEGNITKAIGDYSHAEGDNTQAKGNYSHAEGQETIASGSYSHAEGYLTISSGSYSHAEGRRTSALGGYSHAEGSNTQAIGQYSHAEGSGTQAIGNSSHAEGGNSVAIGDYSHAEGLDTVASGSYQHVQGQYNISSSIQSAFIIGNGTAGNARRNLVFASGSTFQVTGSLNVLGSITGSLFGTASQAISASWAPLNAGGSDTQIQYNSGSTLVGINSFIFNYRSQSLQQGLSTIASGTYSHAEGSSTIASGTYSHAEGESGTIAQGQASHAEGRGTTALGRSSHAEGTGTTASGSYSHAEGVETRAIGEASHAEGYQTTASGSYSHAEGYSTIASGLYSHAEGNGGFATGPWSHVEGGSNQAIGTGSHAEGAGTVALGNFQHVQGRFNISSSANSAFIIGNGANLNNRSNLVFATGSIFQITGSLGVSGSITGSLFGTSSWALDAISSSYAENAATASNILGGKAPHIPYFITDTTLATSSLYQSGSTSVIINQDNNTTANPEALYVWQPHPTSFNVISGKGDINNYLQLNIQNTNQGANASSDVVATADNGNESTNYIDMGINSENYNSGFIGDANDAYLYSTGLHLHIGNASNEPVMLFAGGSDVDVYNKLMLNPNNQHQMTGSLDVSGSLNVRNNITSSGLLTNGTNTIVGNTVMSGSSTIQGTTTMTGSLLITGSTTQVGNNTLLGNTVLSGSIVISGSVAPGNLSASVNIYGDTAMSGFLRFNPYATNIDTSISASYIYVSGSTNDLYFSQNGAGYANTTRLRWLEGNLYTGLLNGGLISTQSSTVYQVSSGSGIVVNLNASLTDNPYPTVTYVNWPTISASIAPLSASYDQSFVSIQADGTLFTQGTPYNDGQFNTLIPIGNVIHQNRSTINATATYPSVAYGYKQRSSDFLRAFGALKLSGLNTIVSGSSTGSISITGGTAYSEGRNYVTDPNNPSYVIETGQPISKIFRYYQSGSGWAYLTNGGAGYETIDPTQYSDNGVLTAVPGTGINRRWSIQRVYYFPGGATKGIYVYYGNQTYASQIEAIANIPYETFVEAPNTAGGAVLSAYLIVRNNADFTVADSYNIQQGGLFRNVGGAGGGGSAATTRLIDLSDVSITSPTNHNLLAYNSSTTKWENVSTITADVTGNVTGTATTASYISPTFISASAAASGFGSGGGGSVDTGSLLTTASFNAYTSSNTSQFAGTASFATTALNLLGSVQTAATASYSTNFTVANSLTLDGTLIDYSSVNSSIVGNNNLYQIATGSYTSAFTRYTVHNGTNARAGEFVTVWNGTTVVSYDNSTTDIGNTSDVTFVSSIVTSQIKIDAVTATSAWKIKSTTTFI